MKKIAHITDSTFNIASHASISPWCYAARAILIDNSNRIALSHEKVTGLYALVGGTLEPYENPEECLLRELNEETGYVCKIQSPLGFITENRGTLNYRKKSFFYVASILTTGTIARTQEEKRLQQEILWLPMKDAYYTIKCQSYNTLQYKFIQQRDILALEEFFSLISVSYN